MQNLPPKIALIYVVFLHVKNYTPLIFSKKTKMHFMKQRIVFKRNFFNITISEKPLGFFL